MRELGGSTDRQPSWPMEIFHTIEVMLSLAMGAGQGAGTWASLLREFESSLFWEFKLFQEFGLFWEFCEVCKNLWVWGSAVAARGLTATRSLGGEKIALAIVWFAYSLLSLFLSLFLLILLAVVLSLLPYWTVFIPTHEFSLLSISPPHPAGGREAVSERLSGPKCQLLG